MQAANGSWVILLSLMVALLLSIVNLPLWLMSLRPEWVVLVVIYWVIALPQRVSVGIAWLAGLVLDVLEGLPMGVNAFALTVVAALAYVLHQRMRMFSFWQQSLMVFVLVGMNLMLTHWVKSLYAEVEAGLYFLTPALISAVIWPWVMIILRHCRRRFHVR